VPEPNDILPEPVTCVKHVILTKTLIVCTLQKLSGIFVERHFVEKTFDTKTRAPAKCYNLGRSVNWYTI
jgi:hypothetical protein